MNVFVNTEATKLSGSSTLHDLLCLIQMDGQKGIAVAVNQSIVPRGNWKTVELKENDSVTIIHATQGG
jgi:sulfur carrier protein